MDNELKAMSTILKTLSELDATARDRVWNWINAKVQVLSKPSPADVLPADITTTSEIIAS